eukprot:1404245-Rhodomonas_salina.3
MLLDLRKSDTNLRCAARRDPRRRAAAASLQHPPDHRRSGAESITFPLCAKCAVLTLYCGMPVGVLQLHRPGCYWLHCPNAVQGRRNQRAAAVICVLFVPAQRFLALDFARALRCTVLRLCLALCAVWYGDRVCCYEFLCAIRYGDRTASIGTHLKDKSGSAAKSMRIARCLVQTVRESALISRNRCTPYSAIKTRLVPYGPDTLQSAFVSYAVSGLESAGLCLRDDQVLLCAYGCATRCPVLAYGLYCALCA